MNFKCRKDSYGHMACFSDSLWRHETRIVWEGCGGGAELDILLPNPTGPVPHWPAPPGLALLCHFSSVSFSHAKKRIRATNMYVENINAVGFFLYINNNGSHYEMKSDKRDSFGLQFVCFFNSKRQSSLFPLLTFFATLQFISLWPNSVVLCPQPMICN